MRTLSFESLYEIFCQERLLKMRAHHPCGYPVKNCGAILVRRHRPTQQVRVKNAGRFLAFAIVPLNGLLSLAGELAAFAESGLAALFVVANLSELIFLSNKIFS